MVGIPLAQLYFIIVLKSVSNFAYSITMLTTDKRI